MPYSVLIKNEPIATQIKNFQNKRSGKVTEARKDILHRFACLDWKDQKRILDLFLDSGKSDREWAYTKLLRIWDASFPISWAFLLIARAGYMVYLRHRKKPPVPTGGF